MRMSREPLVIRGEIRRAYPLRCISSGTSEKQDVFTLGVGPCGHEAARVVTWEIENNILLPFIVLLLTVVSFILTIRRILQLRSLTVLHVMYVVYIYDKWADQVKQFQRHYKVEIKGRGLTVMDWEIGEDTEDHRVCIVVAETELLKKAANSLGSQGKLTVPSGISIQIKYEEPQKIPDSDQLLYRVPRIIDTRTLQDMNRKQPALPPSSSGRNKRTLQMASDDDSVYKYTPLNALMDGKANIYGVVVNMTLPKKSSGKDFYMSVHLIDESKPKREDAVLVLAFFRSLDQALSTLYVGDVVRFHNLKINKYRDTMQGIYRLPTSRFLIVRERPDGSLEYISLHEKWAFDRSDENRVRELMTWSKTALAQDRTLPPSCPAAPQLLGDLHHVEGFVDVIVRVLNIREGTDENHKASIVIWDGSGDRAHSNTALNSRLLDLSDLDNTDMNLRRGVLVKVVIDSCWVLLQCMGFLDRLENGWCRFRNLAISDDNAEDVESRFIQLHFREASSLALMPDYTADVQDRLQAISSPINATEGPSVTTVIPAHITTKVPVSTLEAVRTSSQVPRKYHCVARCVKIWPSDIVKTTKKVGDTFTYSFVIRLEDSSAQLDVSLLGKDAEHFLHGVPPCDLQTNNSSRAVLQKRLAALVGCGQPLHCCIKSFAPVAHAGGQDITSAKPNVRFRMFDTMLQVR
ncbi:TPA: hypothetical protein N0F65_010752 [Lagenidium giganteum]|uniref:Telomeric single stranded DNA binding POT1/Cdc13 domain-containing protein n=1 Tax=Lagenidium giganteum TaxID=4803 RepID=A0AAV2YQV4_9STRA|nr:TPA: hypothetical protein N0F65_010752 [Lagenidium giganteum]